MEERYLNTHLIQSLEYRLRISDIFSWIDQEGERLAQFGLCENGCVEFTESLKKESRIDAIKMISNGVIGEDACIIPHNERYQILYKKGLPENRMRFAIAHEIGHTYWLKNMLPISNLQNTAGRNTTIEYLCDRFAAALLLPKKDLLKRFELENVLKDETILPLHLIQSIAKRYRIADQAVARRLFYHLFPRNVALISIKQDQIIYDLFTKGEEHNVDWKVVWCALPADIQQCELNTDIKIPLRTRGKLIPVDMIPALSEGITTLCHIDSRWWLGIKGQLKTASKIAFNKIPYNGKKEGYACRTGSIIYIALPILVN